MDSHDQQQLEKSLKDLSWWTEPAPALWKKALSSASTSKQDRPAWVHRLLRARWPWIAVPVAAVVVVAITLAWSDAPSYQVASRASLKSVDLKSVDGGYHLLYEISDAGSSQSYPPSTPSPARVTESLAHARRGLGKIGGDQLGTVAETSIGRTGSRANALEQYAGLFGADEATRYAPSSRDSPGAESARHVVRKVSIDLVAEDVRGAYLKVLKMILNEADGEYVEQAQLYGNDPRASAYLTLRVRASRLSAALNALRELGDVTREHVESTDVTSQVIDLEARLRNERRLEQEMLGLLDKRKDSPLQELLKLSESLAQVRERIEKLVARQQHTAHQVALATVVITIRGKSAHDEPVGLTAQLTQQFSSAWADGIAFLIRSMAAIVRVLIGGLIWWVGLGIALVVLRRRYLRRIEAVDGNAT